MEDVVYAVVGEGESVHFYIFGNELNYNCIDTFDIQGVYELCGDVLVSISQEQENLQKQ